MLRTLIAVAVAGVVFAVLGACGDTKSTRGVVVVDGATITKSTIEHWMAALLRTGLRALPAQEGQMLRRQTVSFLIASHWLIGEARKRRLGLSGRDVDEALKQQENSYSTRPEFIDYLKEAGKTVADLRFELELSFAALRRMLARLERRVTPSQIAKYYKNHIQRYAVGEIRTFDIVNHLTEAHALALKGEIERDEVDLAARSRQDHLERPRRQLNAPAIGPGQLAIERAVFSTPLGAIGGPVRLRNSSSIFKVTKIQLPTHRPLSAVREEIEGRLMEMANRQVLTGFLKSWTSSWKARTSCSAGYVVDSCRQHAGPTRVEYPLSADL
jgi:PPIC-type PPIASE domain/SurA N-terminal domain